MTRAKFWCPYHCPFPAARKADVPRLEAGYLESSRSCSLEFPCATKMWSAHIHAGPVGRHQWPPRVSVVTGVRRLIQTVPCTTSHPTVRCLLAFGLALFISFFKSEIVQLWKKLCGAIKSIHCAQIKVQMLTVVSYHEKFKSLVNKWWKTDGHFNA